MSLVLLNTQQTVLVFICVFKVPTDIFCNWYFTQNLSYLDVGIYSDPLKNVVSLSGISGCLGCKKCTDVPTLPQANSFQPIPPLIS